MSLRNRNSDIASQPVIELELDESDLVLDSCEPSEMMDNIDVTLENIKFLPSGGSNFERDKRIARRALENLKKYL